MATSDTGMSKTDMKKLLNRSKDEPVHVAVGLGDDPAVGLLVMHKQRRERAVETLLKEQFPTAKNTRWGTAFVDVDDNPKLVRLTLNKPVSGMARKLIKTLKGTGFSKVVILTEDGSLMDSHEEADEEAGASETVAEAGTTSEPPPAQPAPPSAEQDADRKATLVAELTKLVGQIAQAAGADADRKAELEKLARGAGVYLKTSNLNYGANAVEQLRTALGAAASAPPAAPPPPAAPADPAQQAERKASLTKDLMALMADIPQSAGGDAARKAMLDKLAKDAAVNLKTGNLQYGTNAMEQLRRALAEPPATADDADGEDGDVLAIWRDAKDAVDTRISALSSALRGFDDPDLERIADFGLFGLTDGQGVGLTRALMEFRGATLDRRPAASGTLRKSVDAYRAVLDGNKVVQLVDDNPFGVDVKLRATLGDALDHVERALA